MHIRTPLIPTEDVEIQCELEKVLNNHQRDPLLSEAYQKLIDPSQKLTEEETQEALQKVYSLAHATFHLPEAITLLTVYYQKLPLKKISTPDERHIQILLNYTPATLYVRKAELLLAMDTTNLEMWSIVIKDTHACQALSYLQTLLEKHAVSVEMARENPVQAIEREGFSLMFQVALAQSPASYDLLLQRLTDLGLNTAYQDAKIQQVRLHHLTSKVMSMYEIFETTLLQDQRLYDCLFAICARLEDLFKASESPNVQHLFQAQLIPFLLSSSRFEHVVRAADLFNFSAETLPIRKRQMFNQLKKLANPASYARFQEAEQKIIKERIAHQLLCWIQNPDHQDDPIEILLNHRATQYPELFKAIFLVADHCLKHCPEKDLQRIPFFELANQVVLVEGHFCFPFLEKWLVNATFLSLLSSKEALSLTTRVETLKVRSHFYQLNSVTRTAIPREVAYFTQLLEQLPLRFDKKLGKFLDTLHSEDQNATEIHMGANFVIRSLFKAYLHFIITYKSEDPIKNDTPDLIEHFKKTIKPIVDPEYHKADNDVKSLMAFTLTLLTSQQVEKEYQIALLATAWNLLLIAIYKGTMARETLQLDDTLKLFDAFETPNQFRLVQMQLGNHLRQKLFNVSGKIGTLLV